MSPVCPVHSQVVFPINLTTSLSSLQRLCSTFWTAATSLECHRIKKLVWGTGGKGIHVAPSLGTLSACWHCRGVTCCVSLGAPRFLCSGALPACLGPALGEVVVSLEGVTQYKMQDTLWEPRTLWGVEKATGKPKPIPAKQVVSQRLHFTNQPTSLSAGGYRTCSAERTLVGGHSSSNRLVPPSAPRRACSKTFTCFACGTFGLGDPSIQFSPASRTVCAHTPHGLPHQPVPVCVTRAGFVTQSCFDSSFAESLL